jgi:serine protease AprX
MRGMAPNVELSVAVGLGPEGTTGNSMRVADAIQWCRVSQQVNIISLSLGGPFEATSQIASRSVAGAVEDALDAGIFVVAAAGNAGPDNSDVSTPANVDRVISVGAYDRFLTPWSNSSVGSQIDPYSDTTRAWPNQKPEILAPGSYILSTVSSDKSPPYAYSTGTSDATLFVTGSLALILQDLSQRNIVDISSLNDNRIDIVKQALAESAKPMGGQIGHDVRSGYGMLDAVEWRDRVESSADQW